MHLKRRADSQRAFPNSTTPRPLPSQLISRSPLPRRVRLVEHWQLFAGIRSLLLQGFGGTSASGYPTYRHNNPMAVEKYFCRGPCGCRMRYNHYYPQSCSRVRPLFLVADLRGSSMQLSNPFKILLSALVALAAMYMGSSLAPAQNQPNPRAEAKGEACPNDDSGLQLPAGFCATVFADDIGHARHMVAAPSGVLYVNTWSGKYYGNHTPHAGGFLVDLQDKSGGGGGRWKEGCGSNTGSGGAGGTDVRSITGSIFAEANEPEVSEVS